MQLIELPNGNILNLHKVTRIYKSGNNRANICFTNDETWYDVVDYDEFVAVLNEFSFFYNVNDFNKSVEWYRNNEIKE